MNIISNFTNLFSDVWSKGVGGINFSEVFLAVLIFLLFLFLRGFFSKIIIKKLEKFVSLSTNRFDNQLVTSLEGPVKFFPLVIGFFIATNYLQIDGKASYFIENLNRSLITVLIFWSITKLLNQFPFLLST